MRAGEVARHDGNVAARRQERDAGLELARLDAAGARSLGEEDQDGARLLQQECAHTLKLCQRAKWRSNGSTLTTSFARKDRKRFTQK